MLLYIILGIAFLCTAVVFYLYLMSEMPDLFEDYKNEHKLLERN